MATYNVLLLLHAPGSDDLLERLHEWDLVGDERVLSITAVPDPIEVPPGLSGVSKPDTSPPTPLPSDSRTSPPPVRAPSDG
jgi:hypothetical protein